MRGIECRGTHSHCPTRSVVCDGVASFRHIQHTVTELACCFKPSTEPRVEALGGRRLLALRTEDHPPIAQGVIGAGAAFWLPTYLEQHLTGERCRLHGHKVVGGFSGDYILDFWGRRRGSWRSSRWAARSPPGPTSCCPRRRLAGWATTSAGGLAHSGWRRRRCGGPCRAERRARAVMANRPEEQLEREHSWRPKNANER